MGGGALTKILHFIVCLSLWVPSVHAQENGQNSEVPFKLAHDFLIVVPGRIGNLKGLRFILDTGCTHSTVDRRLARELVVRLSPKRVFEFAKLVQMESGVFSEVEFGSTHLTDVPLLVTDLSHVSEFADNADAIIGSDLLSLGNFSIDYDSKRVVFSPPQQAVHAGSFKTVGMTLTLQVQGHPIDVLVDTGVEGIVLFEDRIQNRIPQMRIIGDTVVGGTRGKWAILPDAHLGPKDLNLKVLLVKGPPSDVAFGVDGYMGIAPLKAHRIDFNLTMATLSWR
jgi:hypothetical protein